MHILSYPAGWGYFVVDQGWAGNSSLALHIACPHPLFDGLSIDSQAASIFQASGAVSLFVAGHHRMASAKDSTCQAGFPVSDPPYNQADPFNVIGQATLKWTLGLGKAKDRKSQEASTEAAAHMLRGEGETGQMQSTAETEQQQGGGEEEEEDAGAQQLQQQQDQSLFPKAAKKATGPGVCRGAWLQLHGKAETSCAESTVRQSGLGLGSKAPRGPVIQ